MSFHQDVMEGINAFTKMREAFHESPYETYYRWKLGKEQADQDMADALIQAQWERDNPGQVYPGKKAAMLGRSRQTGAPTPVVTTAAPGVPFNRNAIETSGPAPQVAGAYNEPQGNYRRGGQVRRQAIYAQGGADIPLDPDDPLMPGGPIPPRGVAPPGPYEQAQMRRRMATVGETGGTPQDVDINREVSVPETTAGWGRPQPLLPPTPERTTINEIEDTVNAAAPPRAASQSAIDAMHMPPRPAANGAGQSTPGGLPAKAAPPPSARPTQAVQPPGQGPLPPSAPLQPSAPARDPNKAFDPSDVTNPQNLGVVRPSGEVDPDRQRIVEGAKSEFEKAVNGGVHFAEWLTRRGENHPHGARDSYALYSGQGAMPAEVAANVYKAWSNGGQLDPGQALTRYMVYRYNALSATGQTAEANKMAFEVLQRLNVEAAKHGGMAIDFLNQGNMSAALKATMMGQSLTPDGKHLAVSKDGTHGVMVDDHTGQPTTQPFAITPQFILGAAFGLSNGTGMWDALAMRAQQTFGSKTKDKDAEGRALRNELTRQRIRILRSKGGGGGGGSSIGSDLVSNIKGLTSGVGETEREPRRQALERERDLAEDDAMSGTNE